jgi:Kef-type K+ transport system membrane component KefB
MSDPAFPHLLITLVALLAAAKALGSIAQRFGQPAVVGELIAGVLLGTSFLGLVDPANPIIQSLAELGVLVLLFEIGLHTDLKSLMNVGAEAITVALVGVALPFGLGYGVSQLLGLAVLPSIVAGAALTATSIGISARTLSDLDQLHTREGQIVLGAAVLDDIVGLVILSVVAGLVEGVAISMRGAAITTALAIIGAFFTGLVLHNTPQRQAIEKTTTSIGHFFVPIFFVSVGAAVDIRTLGDPRALLLGGALIAVGVLGKFLAGFSPFWFKGSKSLIGIAMIPRGEVGLIFARMGLATGALTSQLYSAIALMVLATTFITPPLLAMKVRSQESADDRDRPGDGGIDDLVAGTRQSPARETPK